MPIIDALNLLAGVSDVPVIGERQPAETAYRLMVCTGNAGELHLDLPLAQPFPCLPIHAAPAVCCFRAAQMFCADSPFYAPISIGVVDPNGRPRQGLLVLSPHGSSGLRGGGLPSCRRAAARKCHIRVMGNPLHRRDKRHPLDTVVASASAVRKATAQLLQLLQPPHLPLLPPFSRRDSV